MREGPPRKRACVGLVHGQLFFGLIFFAYFLSSRKESKKGQQEYSTSNDHGRKKENSYIVRCIPIHNVFARNLNFAQRRKEL